MDLEKRIRMAAESILENETIRAGMEDDGANALLDWGTTCAKQIAAATADLEDDDDAEESSYPRMKALRGMLGAVQKLHMPEVEPAQQAELWNEITSHVPVIYNQEAPGLAEVQPTIFAAMQPLGSGEKIRILRALIENKLS
jgi:hypothetical protein